MGRKTRARIITRRNLYFNDQEKMRDSIVDRAGQAAIACSTNRYFYFRY
jgi:hypothetical protein